MKTKKKTMKRHRGIRGSISVFLVIILVPCILVASIFVDVSRVHMSKGIAESASDLALNSLMTYYDYDLNDYYGLMAGCQNIEDFYGVADAYFLRMLNSQDVQDEEVVLIFDQMNQLYDDKFKDQKINDMMLLENKSTGNMTSGVDGATLANPTIMKDQIVEFMKYRAPIVILDEIMTRMKSAPGVNQLVEEGNPTNEKLMEEKEEYYEAEGDFNRAAFYTYWAIRDYYEKADELGMTNDKLSDYANRLEGYRTAYKEIHALLVKNLYNTQDVNDGVYNRLTMNLNKYSYAKDSDAMKPYIHKHEPTAPPSPVYTAPPTASPVPTPTIPPATSANPNPTAPPTFTPAPNPTVPPAPVYTKPPVEYTVTAAGHDAAVENARVAWLKFTEDIGHIQRSCEDMLDVPAGVADAEAYKIQWWTQALIRMDKVVDYAGNKVNLEASANKMLDAYAKLLCVSNTPSNSASPPYSNPETGDTRQSRENRWLSYISSAQAKYLVSGVTASGANVNDEYLKLVNNLESYTSATLGQTYKENLTVVVDGTSMGLNEAIAYINSQMQTIENETEELLKLLEIAINGDGKADDHKDKKVYSLSKLLTKAANYEQEFKEWKNAAKSEETELQKKDMVDIKEIEDPNSTENLSKKVTATSVAALSLRLNNIKGELQNIHDITTSMKYGERTILKGDSWGSKGIETYDAFVSMAARDVAPAAIPYKNKELNIYVDSTFKSLFDPDTDILVKLEHLTDNKYNPMIHAGYGQVDIPELLQTLHDKYWETQRKDVEDKKSEMDKGDKLFKDQQKKIADANRYHGPNNHDITRSYSGSKKFSFAESGLLSLVGLVEALVSTEVNGVATLRDDLYVTTYIMKMFSFATYETEGKYKLLSEEEQKKLKLDGGYYPSRYDQEDVKGKDETSEGTWLSSKDSDSYNKNLRNKMINEANNYAYLGEVEYILYGGKNKDNVKAVYGDIYGIRYTLNLVSGMMNFFKYDITDPTSSLFEAIAATISGATAGIIPAPLIKILLISIFAVFETGKDMERLEAGFPVEIYKTESSEWWYAIPELKDGSSIADATNMLSDGSLGNKENPGTGIFYSDYLTLFVYLGLSNDSFAPTMYKRIGEVMQANMQMLTGDDTYSMEKTQVYFKMDAKLRVRPLMLTLPFFNNYNVDLDATNDWNTYDISNVRGYP